MISVVVSQQGIKLKHLTPEVMFMDSYMIYERRIRILNLDTRQRVFLMPLGVRIDYRTLVQISMYELRKSEEEITEEDWKEYFLSTKRSETNDCNKFAWL